MLLATALCLITTLAAAQAISQGPGIGGATVPLPLSVANGGTGDTGTAWTGYVPVITSGVGTLTTASGTGRYKLLGKTCFITITVNITTNGTGSSTILATLPAGLTANNAGNYILTGRELVVTGLALTSTLQANQSSMTIMKYDNAYPGVNGAVLIVSGTFETN